MSITISFTKGWELFEQDIIKIENALKAELAAKDKKFDKEYLKLLEQAKEMIGLGKELEKFNENEDVLRQQKLAELKQLEANFLPAPISDLRITSRPGYKLYAAYQTHLENFARMGSEKNEAFNAELLKDRSNRKTQADELLKKVREYRKKHSNSPLGTPGTPATVAVRPVIKHDRNDSNSKSGKAAAGGFFSAFSSYFSNSKSQEELEKDKHENECEAFNDDFLKAQRDLTTILANDNWCSELLQSTKMVLVQLGINLPEMPFLQAYEQQPGSVERGDKDMVLGSGVMRAEKEREILALSLIRLQVLDLLKKKEREFSQEKERQFLALTTSRVKLEDKYNGEQRSLFQKFMIDAEKEELNKAEKNAEFYAKVANRESEWISREAVRDAGDITRNLRDNEHNARESKNAADSRAKEIQKEEREQLKHNLLQENMRILEARYKLEKEKELKLALFRDKRLSAKEPKNIEEINKEEQGYRTQVFAEDSRLGGELITVQNKLKDFDSCEMVKQALDAKRRLIEIFKEKEKAAQQILQTASLTPNVIIEKVKQLNAEYSGKEVALENDFKSWHEKYKVKQLAEKADNKNKVEEFQKLALISPDNKPKLAPIESEQPTLSVATQGIKSKYQMIRRRYEELDAKYQADLQTLSANEEAFESCKRNCLVLEHLGDFFDKLLLFKQQSMRINWAYSDHRNQKIFMDALVDVHTAIVDAIQKFSDINYDGFSELIKPALKVIVEKHQSLITYFAEFNHYHVEDDFGDFCAPVGVSPSMSTHSIRRGAESPYIRPGSESPYNNGIPAALGLMQPNYVPNYVRLDSSDNLSDNLRSYSSVDELSSPRYGNESPKFAAGSRGSLDASRAEINHKLGEGKLKADRLLIMSGGLSAPKPLSYQTTNVNDTAEPSTPIKSFMQNINGAGNVNGTGQNLVVPIANLASPKTPLTPQDNEDGRSRVRVQES